MSKQILDVACGGKMFYFDKNDPRVLFCDNRQIKTILCDGRKFKINPDVVCDFTKLPFNNNSFKLVVFDPPHLKGKENPTGWQHIKYGYLDKNWKEIFLKGLRSVSVF